jgi:NAD dependent epimerase/dehydratase family enzyme
MLPLFRMGLGGRLGSGRQWWSFVSLGDVTRAYGWLLEHEVSGPVNVTAPNPATNAEVTRAMGAALHRPTVLAVPGVAIKVALGGFSVEVLGSKRVRPAVLERAGFAFEHPTIEAAIASVT